MSFGFYSTNEDGFVQVDETFRRSGLVGRHVAPRQISWGGDFYVYQVQVPCQGFMGPWCEYDVGISPALPRPSHIFLRPSHGHWTFLSHWSYLSIFNPLDSGPDAIESLAVEFVRPLSPDTFLFEASPYGMQVFSSSGGLLFDSRYLIVTIDSVILHTVKNANVEDTYTLPAPTHGRRFILVSGGFAYSHCPQKYNPCLHHYLQIRLNSETSFSVRSRHNTQFNSVWSGGDHRGRLTAILGGIFA